MLTIEGVYFYFGELSCRVLESVFTLTVWLHKDPGTRVFELALKGSGLRLMIFRKMSPRTRDLTITICNKITVPCMS